MRILVTCEHGGNRVPAEYAALLARAGRLLETHRAYDRGALTLARSLARQFQAPLIHSCITRLVVDLNRSVHHPALWSRYTAHLDEKARQALLVRHYYPYRHRVESSITQMTEDGRPMLHVSVHSFARVRRGDVRRADVGLLYDPSRAEEKHLCMTWQRALRRLRADLVVRRNYPYRGTSDGLTAYLRRRFGPRHYMGIELEVNQRWPLKGGNSWRELQQDVIRAFVESRPEWL